MYNNKLRKISFIVIITQRIMLKHIDKQQSRDYKTALKYKKEKKYSESIEVYTKILAKDPNNLVYLEELSHLYLEKDMLVNALDNLNKIRMIQPLNGVNLNNIGICLYRMGKYEDAIDMFKQILRIKNDIPDVYNNISNCYVGLKRYGLAESVLKISLRLRDDEDIHFRFGNIYFYMKRYEESIEHYKKTPPTHDNLYNISFPYLATNQYEIGFELYENRLFNNRIHPQTGEIQRVEIPQIRDWNGKDPCKRLLVIYEQGIGDNIQYYRFLIELSIRNPHMKITYFSKKIISNILMPFPNIHIETNLIDTSQYEYKMFIMSLPHFLNITKIEPNKINYIIQDYDKISYWKNKLYEFDKPYRVGFVHNGLLSSFIEKNIPIQEFEKLTELGLEMELICICKPDELKEEDKKKLKNVKLFDIDREAAFQDTIAILKNIDLLITIDTAIVHLAGVMGVKTWLLLGYGSDWRWSTKKTTYWYDSVELVRMNENEDLKYIMKTVKDKLVAMCK
jgi:tetratricopeptide (TPR) repeat protein